MLNANFGIGLAHAEEPRSLVRLQVLVNMSANSSRPEEQNDENDTIVTPSTKLSVDRSPSDIKTSVPGALDADVLSAIPWRDPIERSEEISCA